MGLGFAKRDFKHLKAAAFALRLYVLKLGYQ
jgi:hypothetical protein